MPTLRAPADAEEPGNSERAAVDAERTVAAADVIGLCSVVEGNVAPALLRSGRRNANGQRPVPCRLEGAQEILRGRAAGQPRNEDGMAPAVRHGRWLPAGLAPKWLRTTEC